MSLAPIARSICACEKRSLHQACASTTSTSLSSIPRDSIVGRCGAHLFRLPSDPSQQLNPLPEAKAQPARESALDTPVQMPAGTVASALLATSPTAGERGFRRKLDGIATARAYADTSASWISYKRSTKRTLLPVSGRQPVTPRTYQLSLCCAKHRAAPSTATSVLRRKRSMA